MLRLPPQTRDNVLLVIEAICAGRVRMDGTLIAGGYALKPLDVLIAAAHSADRFPALVSELISKSTAKAVSVSTYGEAARTLLLEWPRVQQLRDEAAEFEALAKADLKVEADARRKAEQIKAKKGAQVEKRGAKAQAAPAQRRKAA